MPLLPTQEFFSQPLRVHAFLAGVPLHDVWAVDLPAWSEGITLHEFHGRARKSENLKKVSWPTRALMGLRFFLGRILGLESEPREVQQMYFANRLTAEDREKSLVPAGTPDAFFRVVYRFENEILLEVVNRTVHAASLNALQRTEEGYRFYFAIYVRKISWITPVYMALIDPFRKWVVYPALLKRIGENWDGAFGPRAESVSELKEQ
jgi:hypothetical protein